MKSFIHIDFFGGATKIVGRTGFFASASFEVFELSGSIWIVGRLFALISEDESLIELSAD